jgi:hypothetical protein
MRYSLQTFAWLMLIVSFPSFAAGTSSPPRSTTGTSFVAPSSIKASYEIHKSGIKIGEIEEVFTIGKDHHYTIVSTTRATGLLALFKSGKIIISSSGLVGKHGLKPLKFKDLREGDENRNRAADFDWNTKQLTLIEHKLSSVVPLPEDTQDRLSAMYQFMFLSLDKVDMLSFHMTNGGKLDIYDYRITHDQSVTVPLGTFSAAYVASVPEANSNRTEIWLAGDFDFPYKMVITDPDGGSLSQVLTKFTFTP